MQYYIEDGVRRAVAAREQGLTRILAKLFEQGQPPRLILAPIGDLHSPKTSISRSDARYLQAVQGMATARGRAKMQEILLQPLGEKGQKATVPLAKVVLDP